VLRYLATDQNHTRLDQVGFVFVAIVFLEGKFKEFKSNEIR